MESAPARAWRDYKSHFNRQGYGVGIAVAVLGPLSYWVFEGSASAEAEVAGWVLSSIVPIALLLIGSYLWQLWRAPYRQRNDAREEIQTLRVAGERPEI